MASPQSGTICTADSPEAPLNAVDADVADPGVAAENAASATAEEQSTKEGDETSESEETHMIGIKLEDHEGKPAMHARYRIKLPDGTERSGSLDKEGKVTLEPIPAGQCEISFPDIHQDEWSLKS